MNEGDIFSRSCIHINFRLLLYQVDTSSGQVILKFEDNLFK